MSTRKLTALSHIRPSRYSPFPAVNDSSIAVPPTVTAATVRIPSVCRQFCSGILVQSDPSDDRCGTPCQPFFVGWNVCRQLWSGILVQSDPSDDRCGTPYEPFFVGWTPGALPTVSAVLGRPQSDLAALRTSLP